MEYSPPPLFKQGASARAKMIICALIAIVLLVVDSRMRTLTTIRQAVAIVLYPLQVVALAPRDAANAVGDYFSSVSGLQTENRNLKVQQIANAQTLQQGLHLEAENNHLRKLLAAGERLPVKSVMSEIMYDARDAFTRKIIVDRGMQHGVELGQPVIDDVGVVGQITRVFPFSSEITLLTDKDQAIPVQVVRSGLRSVAYGQGRSGSLDLRFMPASADIKNGDILVTSGLDGVYPPGLAVAKVSQVESKSNDAFARIVCQPLAGIDRHRQLLILLTAANTSQPGAGTPTGQPDKEAGASAASGAAAKEVTKVDLKDAGKAQPANAVTKDGVKQPVAAPVQSAKPATVPSAQPTAAASTAQRSEALSPTAAPAAPTPAPQIPTKATPPTAAATATTMPQPKANTPPLTAGSAASPAPKETVRPATDVKVETP